MIAILAAIFVFTAHPKTDCGLVDRSDALYFTKDAGVAVDSELYNAGTALAHDIMITYEFQGDHGIVPISRLVRDQVLPGHDLFVWVPLNIDRLEHLPGPLVSAEVDCQ